MTDDARTRVVLITLLVALVTTWLSNPAVAAALAR